MYTVSVSYVAAAEHNFNATQSHVTIIHVTTLRTSDRFQVSKLVQGQRPALRQGMRSTAKFLEHVRIINII